MFDILIKYFPQIIAGLVPSILTLAPAIVVIFKNLKVDRNVKDLEKSVKDLLKGDFNVSKVIDNAVNVFEKISTDYLEDLKNVINEVKIGVIKDLEGLEDRFKNLQEHGEAVMTAEIERINKRIKEIGYDNVSSLHEKGQTEVSNL